MKKQVKREEIISAAQKLIIQKGYRETSVEDITNEVGIAKGSFYTYFKSKVSLMETLLSEKNEMHNKELNDILKGAVGFDETVKRYVKHYLTTRLDEAEFILVMMTMMRSIDSIGDVVIERLESGKERRKAEFIDILNKYKDELDIVEEKDIERYSLIVRGLINNFYINNFFPSENRFKETSVEKIKEKINKIDFDYESEFISKVILKLIKK